MSEKKLIEVAKWLNSKGYHIEFETDELWMEDELTEHRFRDLCELLDEYAKSYTLQVIREAVGEELRINLWGPSRQAVKDILTRIESKLTEES